MCFFLSFFQFFFFIISSYFICGTHIFTYDTLWLTRGFQGLTRWQQLHTNPFEGQNILIVQPDKIFVFILSLILLETIMHWKSMLRMRFQYSVMLDVSKLPNVLLAVPVCNSMIEVQPAITWITFWTVKESLLYDI